MAATAFTWVLTNEDPTAILIVEFAGLLIVATVTTAVVRRELRPLEHAAATADSIAAGDLSSRLTEATTAPATEVGRLAVALNRMLDQIQAALTAREASEERMRQFVADASHELRTPLQSLRGYAELYQNGALTDTAAVDTAIDRMLSEVQRMARLVESLLSLARFDEEDRPERERIDLSRVVAESCQDAAAVEPYRPRSVHIEDGLTVLGDAAQLRSLVANLLGNVRMHTAPDTLCSVELTAASSTVTLRVEDRGPGIPEEAQGHVFDRFYRADKRRSRAAGGTGLGLSIVAAIAELHHAHAHLDSTPGHGTTIDIIFPLDEVAAFGE
ncbi:sensor histidine kinase [Streptomyces sp. NPDC101455]|uniref:sensor histidine kinase n=1 Tax=Streptomyces sp. NPDC101455 TaxID=3366142 RepID=UPI00381E739A